MAERSQNLTPSERSRRSAVRMGFCMFNAEMWSAALYFFKIAIACAVIGRALAWLWSWAERRAPENATTLPANDNARRLRGAA